MNAEGSATKVNNQTCKSDNGGEGGKIKLTADTRYRQHKVDLESRSDGTILYRSQYQLGPISESTGVWLHHWAQTAPDRIFLAERSGAGWRSETYRSALQKVRSIAQVLLARGLGAHTPILIISGNGIDHGLLSLAGQYVGVPVAPVAEQYALIHVAHDRLRHAANLIRPKLVYTNDAGEYGDALDLDVFEDCEIVSSNTRERPGTVDFREFLKGCNGVDVDAAFAQLNPDTLAKILLTSGSTSTPKGVLTTQRMLCANQAMIVDSLPFLELRPPIIVDWLPWNHVFGGSHNFNIILANGGSLFIDDGKPMKELFKRTVENLSLIAGTMSFNVPVGFGMLVDALRQDEQLRRTYFGELDMIFYAGASLPQDVWTALESMAKETCGTVPLMTSSWGLTETAPATMIQQEPIDRSGVVGVPMTGVTLKLVPQGDQLYEMRVKGPNVTLGYLGDVQKTKASFDGEGFFLTGDAMRFIDFDDPAKGMCFAGRISDDFKLLTGTWVRVSPLREELLDCLGSVAKDLVIAGADQADIGVLIVPNLIELNARGFILVEDNGALLGAALFKEIHQRLAVCNRAGPGGSTRVARALILSEPPSLADLEVTAKGNLNNRKILNRRGALLKRLYDSADPATMTL